ncbi:hypothetical protein HII36_53250, partial [Nonomuraea sp. NN258]|nr:hypothetical protein [Nonomuraea antri]
PTPTETRAAEGPLVTASEPAPPDVAEPGPTAAPPTTAKPTKKSSKTSPTPTRTTPAPKKSTRAPAPTVSKTSKPPTKTPQQQPTTPKPSKPPTTKPPVEPSTEPEPEPPPTKTAPVERVGCRSWTVPSKGLQMSPCIKVVGDRVFIQARARGTVGMRVDLSIELYDSRTDRTVTSPLRCHDMRFAYEGEIEVCGWYEVQAPGGQPYVARERWKVNGTSTFGGGAESPELSW